MVRRGSGGGRKRAERRGEVWDDEDDFLGSSLAVNGVERNERKGEAVEPEDGDGEGCLDSSACYKVSDRSELGRLDAFLAHAAAPITRSRLQRAIRDGGVVVNGAVVKKTSHKLALGDEVRFVRDAKRPPPGNVLPEALPLRIVYEDAHVLVVDKEPGMCVHPAGGLRSGTLVNALLHHTGASAMASFDGEGGDEDGSSSGDEMAQQTGAGLSSCGAVVDGGLVVRPGIVHRLDRGTSGIMVVAKDDHAHQHLMRQFAERKTRRRYVALVHGCPEPVCGTVRAPLARDRTDRTRMAVVPESERSARNGGLARGKHAVTHYRVLRRLDHASVVEFHLETGRTHQVRVHAAHLGHPLLGDAVYGGASRLLYGPQGAQRRERFKRLCEEVLPRPALHAERLGFEHPYTGEKLEYARCPHEDMIASWAALVKHAEDEGQDSGWLVADAAPEGWE